MWLGPALFVTVSVILWKYLGAVFVPDLLARAIYRAFPGLAGMDLFILINTTILYFGGYVVVAIFWRRWKAYLRNPFFAGLALWLVNLFVILPLLGRGILGYRLPQGWVSAPLPPFPPSWCF